MNGFGTLPSTPVPRGTGHRGERPLSTIGPFLSNVTRSSRESDGGRRPALVRPPPLLLRRRSGHARFEKEDPVGCEPIHAPIEPGRRVFCTVDPTTRRPRTVERRGGKIKGRESKGRSKTGPNIRKRIRSEGGWEEGFGHEWLVLAMVGERGQPGSHLPSRARRIRIGQPTRQGTGIRCPRVAVHDSRTSCLRQRPIHGHVPWKRPVNRVFDAICVRQHKEKKVQSCQQQVEGTCPGMCHSCVMFPFLTTVRTRNQGNR